MMNYAVAFYIFILDTSDKAFLFWTRDIKVHATIVASYFSRNEMKCFMQHSDRVHI